ncbi:hypothetical protein OIV83_005874 [Microbotryomycetes sp. JL201]|nr:hypothetical protein OIV83_005874 [Microbotryomycetes sp. JL201]
MRAGEIRTIIVTFPFLIASSVLLYKRAILGEEQRRLPRPATVSENARVQRHGQAGATATGDEGIPSDVLQRIKEAEAANEASSRRYLEHRSVLENQEPGVYN